jgi:hypothetical protein
MASYSPDAIFHNPADPSSVFGSINANREYSMISALLGPSSASVAIRPSLCLVSLFDRLMDQFTLLRPGMLVRNESFRRYSDSLFATDSGSQDQYGFNVQPQPQDYAYQQAPQAAIPPFLRTGSSTSQSYAGSPMPMEHPHAPPAALPSDPSSIQHGHQLDTRSLLNFGVAPFPDTRQQNGQHDADEVYRRVNAPFDYTVGYHYLMKHLQNGYVRLLFLRLL